MSDQLSEEQRHQEKLKRHEQFRRDLDAEIAENDRRKKLIDELIEQGRKDRIWRNRVKDFFGVPDKEDMTQIEEYKTWAGNNAWMGDALIALRTVIKHQNKDGTCEISDDYYEKNHGLLEVTRTLLQDGFIRSVEVREGAFPHRVTTKGLALYSVLENLLLFDGGLEKMPETECHVWRQDVALKLLTALSGTVK